MYKMDLNWITYDGWYAIKPIQTKPKGHYSALDDPKSVDMPSVYSTTQAD